MKETKLSDLVLSAQAAANKAFEAKDALAVEETAHEAFAAAGFDRADYPTWLNAFGSQLELLRVFSRQDSPATIAAKKQQNENRG